MEVGTSVYYRSKLKNKKWGRPGNELLSSERGVSHNWELKGLCVVNFFTGSDSGTRHNTVYVVALLVME